MDRTKIHSQLQAIGILLENMKELSSKPEGYDKKMGAFLRKYYELFSAINATNPNYTNCETDIAYLMLLIKQYLRDNNIKKYSSFIRDYNTLILDMNGASPNYAKCETDITRLMVRIKGSLRL